MLSILHVVVDPIQVSWLEFVPLQRSYTSKVVFQIILLWKVLEGIIFQFFKNTINAFFLSGTIGTPLNQRPRSFFLCYLWYLYVSGIGLQILLFNVCLKNNWGLASQSYWQQPLVQCLSLVILTMYSWNNMVSRIGDDISKHMFLPATIS